MILAELGADFNTNTLIALGALGMAGIAIVIKLLDKGMSLREHIEFSSATKEELKLLKERQTERVTIREFAEARAQINRDFDRIEADLRIIDETKPSAETLQEAMKAVDVRVSHLEAMVRDIKKNGH